MQSVFLLEEIRTHKETPEMNNMEKRPCEDMTKRRFSTGQGKRPQRKLNLLTHWSSRLPEHEGINFCCLSHIAGDIFVMETLVNSYR